MSQSKVAGVAVSLGILILVDLSCWVVLDRTLVAGPVAQLLGSLRAGVR